MVKVKNKKYIYAIVKYFYPVVAGIETNMLETYSVLAKGDWKITIHTSNLDYTTQKFLKEKEKIRKLNVKRYKFNRLGFFPNVDLNKADIVALHNFDIFPHFWILLYSLILKLLGKKKFALVLTPHGGFNPEWSMFPVLQRVIKYLYHYTLGTLLINSVVNGVRAVSEWERCEMIKKGINEDKVKVISNGIEDEAFEDTEKLATKKTKEKVKKLGKYIIQIGRIYPIKNYETTIGAMKAVPEDTKFVIVGPVGSKTYKKELEKLIEDLGLENRVIFWGVVRGIDKYYLIKNAEMMVHMAIWESFCNVVHEAMSQGLPVIVANNTALSSLVRNRGYLVDTKDYKKVAEKINYILKNKNSKEIKEMKKVNREFGKKHAWSRVAEKMNVLYNSC